MITSGAETKTSSNVYQYTFISIRGNKIMSHCHLKVQCVIFSDII